IEFSHQQSLTVLFGEVLRRLYADIHRQFSVQPVALDIHLQLLAAGMKVLDNDVAHANEIQLVVDIRLHLRKAGTKIIVLVPWQVLHARGIEVKNRQLSSDSAQLGVGIKGVDAVRECHGPQQGIGFIQDLELLQEEACIRRLLIEVNAGVHDFVSNLQAL